MSTEFGYKEEVWSGQYPDFVPVELVASIDKGEAYEVNELHLYKLKRGYALVHESGCSCYETSEANVDFYPSKQAVKDKLFEGSKETYSYGELCRDLLREINHKAKT